MIVVSFAVFGQNYHREDAPHSGVPTLLADSKQINFRQYTNHYIYKRFKYRQILLLKPGIHGPKSCQVVVHVFYEIGGFWVQRNIFEQITHIKTGFLIDILFNTLSNVLLLKVSFGEWIICEKNNRFPTNKSINMSQNTKIQLNYHTWSGHKGSNPERVKVTWPQN